MFDDIGTLQPESQQSSGIPTGAPPSNLPIAPAGPVASAPAGSSPQQPGGPPTGVVDMFSEAVPAQPAVQSAVSAGKIAPKIMPEVPQPQSQKTPKKKGNKKTVLILLAGIVGLGSIVGITVAILSAMKQPTLEDLPAFDTAQDTVPPPATSELEQDAENIPDDTDDASLLGETDTPAKETVSNDVRDQQQDTPVLVDTDGDGLNDNDETQYGTNPFFPDTDFDGLTDREEIQTYTTDPLSKDTDGDGFDDGQEVRNGYNPKGPGKVAQ